MKALHKNVNQYTKSGSAPIKAAGLGETTIGIVFMHDAVAQTVAGFPIVTVAPCEGTGYEIGSMSLIKGARNPEAAKKFYDWALTAEVQSRAQEANSFQVPSNKAAKTVGQGARPVDDQADRLRLQEVRVERRAQAPAVEMGQRGRIAAAVTMRAREGRARASSDRHPVDGGRMAGLCRAALVRAGRQFLHAVLAVRRLSARRRRCAGAVPGSAGPEALAGAARPAPARAACCCGTGRSPIRCSAGC